MRRHALVVASIVGALALGGSPVVGGTGAQSRAGSTSPASYEFLKAQVFTVPGLGAIAVGMPTERVVKVQQRRADGTWTRPRVLFKKQGVTCGEIEGRASSGGVALLLECDSPYYEDQAPVHSMAFVTRDLSTWTGKLLEGEAHQDPAISAGGAYAAWLSGGVGDYQLWSATTGFTRGSTSFDYDSGGETVVVDDAGTVTVIGPDSVDGSCALGVYDRPLAGPEDAYVIPGVDPGCTEGGVDNVDDRTVTSTGNREYRFVVTREPGERWALTTPPPIDAPGLVTYQGPYKRVIRNVFSDADGLPLISIGSPDRQHVTVQAYDDDTDAWGPARTVYDHGFGGCTAAGHYPYEPRPKLHALPLHCYGKPRINDTYPPFENPCCGPAPRGKVRLLTSPDGVDWTVTNLGRRPYGLSRNGALLAAPGPSTTTVVSSSGTVSLPVSATGRCDFVFPIGRDSLLRLHGGANAAWPTTLQKSVAGGRWRTIQKVPMPKQGRCGQVGALHDDPPSRFFLRDHRNTVSLVVRRGGAGGWHVERFTF